ncbi:MAG TPA: PHP domain-containing protein [Candidatus Cryosericum sp.]|nr:PHP domain-containing protein [Candidatus Cryosericum sp.]
MTQSETQKTIKQPFDLHLHSKCSDGSDTPSEVISRAASLGVTLAALTDHDCVTGVTEALEAGKRFGVRVLPALEMDTEWPHELHILGLDVDTGEPGLQAALQTARERRAGRNEEIERRLREAGADIDPFLDRDGSVATRLHFALALVAGGFATDAKDAFRRYLRRGCPGYYMAERFTPQQVISLVLGAGGVPVWAHPTHGGPNLHALAEELTGYGLMGLEAFHPSVSEGESAVLLSIARQKGLLVTCGSDYHGANRAEVVPGQAWRAIAALEETRAFFESRPAKE